MNGLFKMRPHATKLAVCLYSALTWWPCGCIWEKACSGRDDRTVNGLDTTPRLGGGVEGELVSPPPCVLPLTELFEAETKYVTRPSGFTNSAANPMYAIISVQSAAVCCCNKSSLPPQPLAPRGVPVLQVYVVSISSKHVSVLCPIHIRNNFQSSFFNIWTTTFFKIY